MPAEEQQRGDGLVQLQSGEDVKIVTSGSLVHVALEAAKRISAEHKLNVSVIDVVKIEPLNEELLTSWLCSATTVVTLYDPWLHGDLGSAVVKAFADRPEYLTPEIRCLDVLGINWSPDDRKHFGIEVDLDSIVAAAVH